jgi:predicted lactoylglutathione lyase
LVTLGVTNLSRSTSFYGALGWPLSKASVPGEVSFFRTAGAVLALWGSEALAADAGLDTPGNGFRGVALAINCVGRDQVDETLRSAQAAGGTIVREAHATDWGGYSGYFADPDGHVWEVAHNPAWPLSPEDQLILP